MLNYPPNTSLAMIKAGPVTSFSGRAFPIRVYVKPVFGSQAVRLVHRETGISMTVNEEPYTSEDSGMVSFEVPHVDNAGWFTSRGEEITGWHYLVRVVVTTNDGTQTWSTAVSPVTGQDQIDLDNVPDGVPALPMLAPIPAVTSVNGQTGAVVIAAGTGGEAAIIDTSNFVTTSSLSEGLATKVDTTTYTQGLAGKAATNHTHTEYAKLTQIPAPYDDSTLRARMDELNATVAAGPDLSGYATTTALSTGLSGKVNTSTHTALADRVTTLEEATPAAAPTGVVLVEDPATPGALKFQLEGA